MRGGDRGLRAPNPIQPGHLDCWNPTRENMGGGGCSRVKRHDVQLAPYMFYDAVALHVERRTSDRNITGSTPARALLAQQP